MTRIIAAAAIAALLASCSTTSEHGYQIPGHKYRTVKGCERKAPIGEFDRRCDVPVVGWHGAEAWHMPAISAGGNASGPSF